MSEQSGSRPGASRVLLTVDQAAEFLGTTPRHVRRLVEERRIPFIKLGSGRAARLRFDQSRLDGWLDAHTVEPEEGI